MITAKIVADSVSIDNGNRITTFLLTYPRFIHSEFMTHRVFSRNAASSRAIPLKKMISNIRENTAGPVHWGAEQKGMQSGGEVENKAEAQKIWAEAAESAIGYAEKLAGIGLHKSICNRVIEPFAHMTTLMTSTQMVNFFNLRAHKDAQPEFQELAYQMLELWLDNKPVEKKVDEWHLPFADKYVSEGLTEEQLLKIVVARAARTSYLNMENEIDHQKDYDLHDRLLASKHLSPFEHAARADGAYWFDSDRGNFDGWIQYRKNFPSENMIELTAQRRTHA